jgi:hypothetical protein
MRERLNKPAVFRRPADVERSRGTDEAAWSYPQPQ